MKEVKAVNLKCTKDCTITGSDIYEEQYKFKAGETYAFKDTGFHEGKYELKILSNSVKFSKDDINSSYFEKVN